MNYTTHVGNPPFFSAHSPDFSKDADDPTKRWKWTCRICGEQGESIGRPTHSQWRFPTAEEQEQLPRRHDAFTEVFARCDNHPEWIRSTQI